MRVIACRVLGPVSLEVDGRPAPPELLWRKHLALLVYLARSPRRGRTREHLTGLLWPEKEESAARHSLNEALRVIRRAAGDAALESSAGQIRLGEDVVWLDTEALERAIAARAWAEAAGYAAGEFLEGFALPGAEAFEHWLAAERLHWRTRSVTALLGHAEALLAAGRVDAALAEARRAEAQEPHSELVAGALLTALALSGEPAAALTHFEGFAARLRDAGGAPSEPLRALAARIPAARGLRPPAERAESPSRRRAPLTGRAPELAALCGAWERCRAGDGATAVLLSGDSGSGKSRLLEELLGRARLSGASVALMRAVEADAREPASGLLGLGRGGLLEAPGLPAAPAAALRPFARVLPDWAERFPGVAAESPASWPHAMTGVLDAVLAAGPLLLAVDDAHWLDRESFLVLEAALRDFPRAPLCLALAALPDAGAELVELRRRLGQEIPGCRLTLGPLDSAALGELAAWALPGYDPLARERITRRVSSDSAGLPLLAVELLSAVAAGLDLQQSPGTWPEPFRTLTQSLPADLPDSVTAAVRIGFRRLSPAAQTCLAAAAALDDRVSESQLVRATGLDPVAVQQALDELEWQRWLAVEGRGYGFVARLVRQIVADDMLTPGQRVRIRDRATA